ncbi:MAG: DEAD/DEAH box helicase [Nitriliruptoraceae bacterium]
MTPEDLRELAQAHLDGLASDAERELLDGDEQGWIDALRWLRRDVTRTIQRLDREVTGPERTLVLADFEEERDRIDEVLTELIGEDPREAERPEDGTPTDVAPRDEATTGDADAGAADTPASEDDVSSEPQPPQLQLSWHRGSIVAWSAGQGSGSEPDERVRERLDAAGAPTGAFEGTEPITLPGGDEAPALQAEIRHTLGWLVALATSTAEDDDLAPSVTWIGLAAALAVRLVGQGRMVPQLRKVGDAPGNRSYFAVRWEPTLIDHEELTGLVKAMPGAVAALEGRRDARTVTRSIVAGFVDAICQDAAGRVEVPAPPPQPQRPSEIAEAALGRLDGSTFEAPHAQGTEIRRGLEGWASGVTGASKLELIVQLDPPDEGDAWLLRTLVPGGRRQDEPVEAAMSRANHERKELIKRELERLEGLYQPLERGKDRRRGEVILSQDEAWELMTQMGSVLTNAGFEVRVPPLSTKKASSQLKLTSVEAHETAVGAQQLSDVRWSAVFGDEELTAEEIRELASQSRPLVKSQGKWVAVDHADLEAAAEALAERADKTRLSGADMLRYALGLDGTALGRPIQLEGEGWAAELLRSAAEIPEHPPTSPEGFEGELRSYQADALAWLGFLESAGLGGCLALDMGLGKTPTLLAQLRRGRDGDDPALVIAPPAVVGNWANEAARFVPDLRVVVHHGANRASTSEVAEEAAGADVVLTTYGTALRDIDALAAIPWSRLVLDEAQVIKNPASETAQQLRRLEARTRVVLTGTPIENGLGDLWALLDFVNPGLLGDRATFVSQMQQATAKGDGAESALRTLNGVLVFRRTKAEPVIAAELPDRIDALDHCPMTSEQIGLYQAVLDELVVKSSSETEGTKRKGAVLAAITALKQICNHPAAYTGDDGPLAERSGKLARLEEIVDNVFESGERMLIFTHFASWGERLAHHLTERTGRYVACYHGGLARGARDRMISTFQEGTGPGAMVLSLKAGGTGLNLTSASHVVLYDRWWNPAVEDQARDRVWRIGQTRTVVAHRLVCPGTVDERVEEVVAGKRQIADLALPKSSSVGDLDSEQLRRALGIDTSSVLTDDTLTLNNARGDAA